jgi:hypothetical protein
MGKFRILGGIIVCLAFSAGCEQNGQMVANIQRGELGLARNELLAQQVTDKTSRSYIIQKERTAIVTLADGYALAGDKSMEDLFAVLQLQGTNAGKDDADVFLWDGATITWKGEPFEQALGFEYIATHYAALGDWGNARAAAEGSLFKLKDFSKDRTEDNAKAGNDVTWQEIVAADKDKDKAADGTQNHLNGGYVATDTNFTLGYLMSAVANQQMANDLGDQQRSTEANDYYNRVVSLNSSLTDMISVMRSGNYNTLLIVDFGKGPEKIGTGPDGAISDFQPITPSGAENLNISLAGSTATQSAIQICDVNAMAHDHKWKGLEDLRVAKSYVGDALLAAGAGTVGYGAYSNNSSADYVGLGLMLGGLIAKASAHCDTTYCEVIPQRVYVVPLMITSPNTSAELQIDGKPNSKLTIRDLNPPIGKTAIIRNVRLPNPPADKPLPTWVNATETIYANDYNANAGAIKLPYILGGTDVRTPTADVLSSYQAAGFLTDLNLSDLQQLYKLEGIGTSVQEDGGIPKLHVLESGKSLVAPAPGTIGYTRIFCQQHAPYQPISDRVKQLAQECAQKLKPPAAAGVAMSK